MRSFFKNKPLVIMVAAICVFIILAIATSGERTISTVENAVGSVTQPINSFASKVSGAIINFFKELFNTTDADIENQQLKSRLAVLEQAEMELQLLKQENERLKELLNFSESLGSASYVTASVTGKTQGIWFDIIRVNAGRNKGVEVGMAVVSYSGLVGRVTEVGANWAKIITIIDSGMSVGVMVERTRINGMVRGTLTTGTDVSTLELYYLPAGSDLIPGDKIITSDIGEIYPKGITVGTVVEVQRQTDTSATANINATVKPSVDFQRLEEVLIITRITKDLPEETKTPEPEEDE